MNNWDQYQSTPKLLPPTVFEKTSDSLPNQSTSSDFFPTDSQLVQFTNELDKLKNEIKKLHSENEALRHRNRDFIDQAQLYTEVSEHRKISITALEEVILKQTKEIQQLKNELSTEKESNNIKIQNIESKYNEKLNELNQKLSEANALFKVSQKDAEEKIEKLTNDKKTLIESHAKDYNDLNLKYESLRSENEALTSQKDIELKKISSEKQKLYTELENLKAYVQNSMPTIQTVKEMTLERQTYEEEILKLKSKIELLKNENGSLQIRLKSINEILSLQENQLESTSVVEKKRLGLLNKWRCKVYELLIQLKSQELNFKQEKNNDVKEIENFRQQLNDQSLKTKILENVIEDKKAELSVLSNDVSNLNEQIVQLKDINESLEQKRVQDLQSSIELKNFVEDILKNYQIIEESFRTANKKLNHLDQRVEFAKNRLGVIKALYSSRREVNKANVLDITTNLSSIHGLDHASVVSNLQIEDKEDVNFIKAELGRVVEERDLLANKLRQDMETMDEKLLKMKDEYEVVIMALNEEIKELRLLNEEKDEKIVSVNRQLEEKSEVCEGLVKKYQDLDVKYQELKTSSSIESEKNLRDHETQFMDKMAKMNEKLNEARREQAKAVVLMRQMERSTNREKERMENLLKSCDNYYKEHLKNLQDKLVSLEKEKNILMNSLRQQGMMFNDVKNHKSDKDYEEEITSFWMDSNQQIEVTEDEEKQQEASRIQASNIVEKLFDDDKNNEQDEQENEVDELNDSDLSKNTEILQQIRKIMGNLELSDVDDDEENEEEIEDKYKNKDYQNENLEKSDRYGSDEEKESVLEGSKKDQNSLVYQYDIEHVIDDLINKKN